MNPIVAQVLTIVGVLLGSAATFVVTTRTERARWRRAQAARWDDKRLQAYTEYANTVKQMVRLCRRVAETKGLLPTGQHIDVDSAEIPRSNPRSSKPTNSPSHGKSRHDFRLRTGARKPPYSCQ